MSNDKKNKGLWEARQFLRGKQAETATGLPGFPYAHLENVSEHALEWLHDQRKVIPTGASAYFIVWLFLKKGLLQ